MPPFWYGPHCREWASVAARQQSESLAAMATPVSNLTPGLRKVADTDLLGPAGGALDRFIFSGATFSLVEHRLPPKALAVPLHRHSREDEMSFILEGKVGAMLGDELVVGEPGDLVIKPRGQWHTFWNAGDSEARLLEIIAPGGLEEAFRELDTRPELADPELLAALAARFGAEMDFEGTMPIVERFGLVF